MFVFVSWKKINKNKKIKKIKIILQVKTKPNRKIKLNYYDTAHYNIALLTKVYTDI